jgi:hypothetical protein
MNGTELLDTSRRERDLYAALLAVYGELRSALADASPVDPAWLAGQHARAERVAADLRTATAALAPHRLTGTPVAPAVQAVWRESAQAAADAAAANRDCVALARARQAAVTARIAELHGTRRSLAAYRPALATRTRLTDAHA